MYHQLISEKIQCSLKKDESTFFTIFVTKQSVMNIIKRILQDKISERIEPNKAVLLFGARRVGKTVLIRELIKEFKGQSMLLNGEDYDRLPY